LEDENLVSNRPFDLGTRPAERYKWVRKEERQDQHSAFRVVENGGRGLGLGKRESLTEWQVEKVPRSINRKYHSGVNSSVYSRTIDFEDGF
jgi:hypothetical protein